MESHLVRKACWTIVNEADEKNKVCLDELKAAREDEHLNCSLNYGGGASLPKFQEFIKKEYNSLKLVRIVVPDVECQVIKKLTYPYLVIALAVSYTPQK